MQQTMRMDDLPEVLAFRIEEEDILTGSPQNCILCPAAKAINRVLPPGFRASIGYGCIMILLESGQTRVAIYDVTQYLESWIHKYDRRRLMAPQSFRVKRRK